MFILSSGKFLHPILPGVSCSLYQSLLSLLLLLLQNIPYILFVFSHIHFPVSYAYCPIMLHLLFHFSCVCVSTISISKQHISPHFAVLDFMIFCLACITLLHYLVSNILFFYTLCCWLLTYFPDWFALVFLLFIQFC